MTKKEETTKETPTNKDSKIETTEKEQDKKVEVKKSSSPNKLKQFLSTKKGKIVFTTSALLLIITTLIAIPATRYPILGNFIKKDLTITFIDSETKKPVTEVKATIDNQQATSDQEGKAHFQKVSVGHHNLKIEKKYYQEQTNQADIWIFKDSEPNQIEIQATGRQVPVKITNKIDKQPVENALLTAADTTATTNSEGEAIIVLPSDQTEVEATISKDEYNNLGTNITVTEEADKNNFQIVPEGKIYFLNEQSNSIDIMKSNLDGTDKTTVLKGTNKFDNDPHRLYSSSDWNFVAFEAKRDNDEKRRIYIIDTRDDSIYGIDHNGETPEIHKWYDNYLIYEEYNYGLKTFNTNNKEIVTLERFSDTREKYYWSADERITSSIQTIKGEIVYGKYWECRYHSGYTEYTCPPTSGEHNYIIAVEPDGSNRRVLHETELGDVNTGGYFNITAYKPNELWISQIFDPSNHDNRKYVFFIYKNRTLSVTPNLDTTKMFSDTRAYSMSPSKDKSIWIETRDSKTSAVLGDQDGYNEKVIMTSNDYIFKGWYSDKYIVIEKDSELYITTLENPEENALKISNYYRPGYYY